MSGAGAGGPETVVPAGTFFHPVSGVWHEEGKMVAHAWLRFGEMYVTGGDGGGYTTVARFCKEASGKRG